MLRTRFAFPVIIAVLAAGFLLTTSNPWSSQPAHAAPDQQPVFEITTEMVPNNWSLIPSGLGSGDSFRLLFVTDGTTAATSNLVSHYNGFVQNEAKKNTEVKANMAVLFRALVSVYEGIDARGNTRTRHLGDSPDPGHSSPIYWVKGDKAADGYADFYDGSWDSRNYKNSKGADIHPSGGLIWTGTNYDGTPAYTDQGTVLQWSLALGSPTAWWNLFRQTSAVAQGDRKWSHITGNELLLDYRAATDSYPVYGLSPLFKVRNATGPKPVISGPTEKVKGPFDVTITFPDDYLVIGMKQDDIKISGGSLSNFRHTAGAGTATGDRADETGTVYTVTVTPNYAPTIYDSTTVSISMGAGAVTDSNGWASVASDTYTVKSSYVKRVATTIPFDSDGVGTVPRSWAFIPSTSLKAGDSFRLLFVTSDTRDAHSRNIDDYNRFVQNAAGRNELFKGFKSRFRVLASTYFNNAIDNAGTTGTGVPIYWVESAKVADSYTDFYDGSWASKAGTDEAGKRLGHSTDIWTGTNSNGTRHGQGLGSRTFYAIYADLGRHSTFGDTGTSISYKNHFYALSPVLKIAEPGGL